MFYDLQIWNVSPPSRLRLNTTQPEEPMSTAVSRATHTNQYEDEPL